ncbi:hypothetical protein ACUIJN_23190 [Metabacillus halosaccharovorans]|uniref:hypothetical protein n=1 Tax=Metabacillus halosaccharovorans TaxID=930124 RepID=UPI00403DE71A
MEFEDFFSLEEDTKQIFESYSLIDLTESIEEIVNNILTKYFLSNDVNTYIHKTANVSNKSSIEGRVYIGPNVTVQDYAYIKGPAIILKNTLIGKSSFLRGGTFIGSYSTVGHASEIVSSIIMNRTSITHFNMISNSIIGNNVNLSAFVTCSSFLLKNRSIINLSEDIYIYYKDGNKKKLNATKFGAIIGDNCRLGAYVIAYPGVTMAPGCVVYPQISLKSGFYKGDSRVYIPNYYSEIKCEKIENNKVGNR